MMFANDARPEWLCINSLRAIDKIARGFAQLGKWEAVLATNGEREVFFQSIAQAATHSGISRREMSRDLAEDGVCVSDNGFEYRLAKQEAKV